MTKARLGSGIVVLVGFALGLTACTATHPVTGASSSVSALKQKYPEQIDLARARGKCLETKGWPVSVRDDASISIDLKAGTEAAYDRDDARCLKELGVDPDAPPSEAVFKNAYAQSVEGAACLREAGWSISPKPTYGTFKSTYETAPWYPWGEVPERESDDALQACPAPGPQY